MKKQQKERTPAQRRAHRRWAMPSRSQGTPLVTYSIILLTAVVWIAQQIPGLGVTQRLGFAPAYLFSGYGLEFEPWRMLTSALVHQGFWHLGLNMLALWLIGATLEPMIGRARMLLLYVIGAVGGSAAVAILAPATMVVGASGAVFALFGAVIIVARARGANIQGILIVVGINLVIGFIPNLGISWQAHIGGLITGLLIGVIFSRLPNNRVMQSILLSLLTVSIIAAAMIIPRILW